MHLRLILQIVESQFPMTNKFKLEEIIEVKAKPNASKSEIIFENNKINVVLKSVPDDNKANEELLKLFRKQLKVQVEIVSGFKSKNKRIVIKKLFD